MWILLSVLGIISIGGILVLISTFKSTRKNSLSKTTNSAGQNKADGKTRNGVIPTADVTNVGSKETERNSHSHSEVPESVPAGEVQDSNIREGSIVDEELASSQRDSVLNTSVIPETSTPNLTSLTSSIHDEETINEEIPTADVASMESKETEGNPDGHSEVPDLISAVNVLDMDTPVENLQNEAQASTQHNSEPTTTVIPETSTPNLTSPTSSIHGEELERTDTEETTPRTTPIPSTSRSTPRTSPSSQVSTLRKSPNQTKQILKSSEFPRKIKGIVGITTTGTTNLPESILQCLFVSSLFRNYLQKAQSQGAAAPLKSILRKYTSAKSSLNIEDEMKLLDSSLGINSSEEICGEEDADSFIQKLLRNLSESKGGGRAPFEVNLKKYNKCERCKTISRSKIVKTNMIQVDEYEGKLSNHIKKKYPQISGQDQRPVVEKCSDGCQNRQYSTIVSVGNMAIFSMPVSGNAKPQLEARLFLKGNVYELIARIDQKEKKNESSDDQYLAYLYKDGYCYRCDGSEVSQAGNLRDIYYAKNCCFAFYEISGNARQRWLRSQ